jgi:hypothetical protein
VPALVALNAILLNVVVRDLIQYKDERNSDNEDDDSAAVDISRTIFLPSLLFDIYTLSPKQCVQ